MTRGNNPFDTIAKGAWLKLMPLSTLFSLDMSLDGSPNFPFAFQMSPQRGPLKMEPLLKSDEGVKVELLILPLGPGLLFS